MGAFSQPEELREGCEHDLRGLKRDVLDVVHFGYVGAPGTAPFLESLDAMIAMKTEGKIPPPRPQQRERVAARAGARANADRGGPEPLRRRRRPRATHAEVDDPDTVLAACEDKGIAFLPFFPLLAGGLGKPQPALAAAMERHRATAAQIAIAWLLARSPVMLPIPGTSLPAHLEENWAARKISIGRDEVDAIAGEARAASSRRSRRSQTRRLG